MSWVESTNDLKNFLSFVVLYAPDEFPEEDYLEDHEQLDLEMAFEELDNGLQLLKGSISENGKYRLLQSLLNNAYSEYKAGNDVKGAHLIQEFEELAFDGK